MLGFINFVTSSFSGLLNFSSPVSLVSTGISDGLQLLISKLPDGGHLPDGVHSAAIYFGSALGKVNFILPTDILVSCLVIILGLRMLLFGFHILLYFVNFIRGIPTSRYRGDMV